MTFTSKEMNGKTLKKWRESRNLTIADLSQSTRISKSVIVAMEEDNFQALPAPVYVRGFIMEIARRLEIEHRQEMAIAYLIRLEEGLKKVK